MMRTILLLIALVAVQCKPNEEPVDLLPITDHHVHLMSQAMVDQFKAYEIPFSHNEPYYTDIDSILFHNPAKEVFLISMAYVWANPDFYAEDDWKEKMQNENDNILDAASSDALRIKPFFAINPLADNALSELKRCVDFGQFSGMKMHFNSSQVYLTEPEHLAKIKEVFSEFSNTGLPLLLHFDNSHPKTGSRDVGLLLNEVLKGLNPMTIIVAHLGNSGGFNDKTIDIVSSIEKLQNEGKAWQHRFYYDLSAAGLVEDTEYVKKLTDDDSAQTIPYIPVTNTWIFFLLI